MSRLDYITILIVVVGIIALSYLIYMIYQDRSAQTSRINEVEDSYAPDQRTDDETTGLPSKDYNNSITPQDDDYYDDEGQGYQESVQKEDLPAYEEEENLPEMTAKGGEETTSFEEERVSESSDAGYGAYMVIAGTFSQKQNAENQVKRLKDMGYSNASMHIFDRGAYAVVIVDRFDNYSAANRLKNELISEHRVDAIIQKKK